MALTDSRREMLEEICTILRAAGHWGDSVRVLDGMTQPPVDLTPPFCLVVPMGASFTQKASNMAFMSWNVALVSFTDLESPMWSVLGHGETDMGLVELQDKIFEEFRYGDLNGLAHRTFVIQHEEATPVVTEERDFLMAPSVLEIRHFQYAMT